MNYFKLIQITAKVIMCPFIMVRFLERWAKNAETRLLANLHSSVKLLPGARFHNILKRQDAISVGPHTVIAGELLTFGHGGKIEVGEWCYIGDGTKIWSAKHVKIGDRVLISHNVNIHDTDSHPINGKLRHEHFVEISQKGHPQSISTINSESVVIGDDVWIGFNVIVLKGVRIGSGSVVAAGSTVCADIPPNCLFVKDKIIRKLS